MGHCVLHGDFFFYLIVGKGICVVKYFFLNKKGVLAGLHASSLHYIITKVNNSFVAGSYNNLSANLLDPSGHTRGKTLISRLISYCAS